MSKEALETQLYHKFMPHSRWVVALSGGADSVALLRLLCALREELSLTVFAAHVHHGLRDSAERDLAFVRKLCRRLSVPLYSTRVHADTVAKERGISLEEAGRSCRYEFLMPLAKRLDATVLTAHTLNDQAETMLLYLTRGNGPSGLAGIREWREDGVFRPLLSVTKEELLAYLDDLGQDHCEDETNKDPRFLRNCIRHQVLPILTAANPSFLQGVLRTTTLLQDENSFLEQETEAALQQGKGGEFSLSFLQSLHPAILRRLIRESAKRFCGNNNLATTETDSILLLIQKGVSGKMRPIGKAGNVQICNESVNFSKMVEKSWDIWYNITVPQSVQTPLGNILLSWEEKCPDCGLALDAEKVGKDLVLRTRKAGDRITIGAGKHQKISDLLTNRKVPRTMREQVLLLCQGETVLAVLPDRVAYGYGATDKTTRFLSIQQRSKGNVSD